ncbi:MAG: hypothetical protein C0594_03950 [Marinilabiliales bacterium]|nr:MAG: hypothetical protein C0594_03950 [Marinilabiliales bacterium]
MKKLLIVIAFFIAALSNAQDVHFSQPFNAPLLLNPAYTGYTVCKFRIGGNVRTQWLTIGKPYMTENLYVDRKINIKVPRRMWIGVGGTVFNDRAGNGFLNRTAGNLSGSANIGFLRDNRLFLTVGVALGFGNRSVRTDELFFADQWNGTSFDGIASSAEPITNQSKFFYNIDGGAMLSYELPMDIRANIGASVYHINKPNESFSDYLKLQRRYNFHGSIMKSLTYNLNLFGGAVFSMQNGARETNLGFTLSYTNYDLRLFFGAWHRLLEDIIPTAGFEYRKLRVIFSYDLNISELKAASSMHGGPEIAIVKTFNCGDRIPPGRAGRLLIKPRKKYKPMPCPAYK